MRNGCVANEGVYLVSGLSQLLSELLNRFLLFADHVAQLADCVPLLGNYLARLVSLFVDCS
jgi:hypothetical protein